MTKKTPITYAGLPNRVWRAARHGLFLKAAWIQARHDARHSARWLAQLSRDRGFDFNNINVQ